MGTGHWKTCAWLVFLRLDSASASSTPMSKKNSIANSAEFAIFFLLLYLQEWCWNGGAEYCKQNSQYPSCTWEKEKAKNMHILHNSDVEFCRRSFHTHIQKKKYREFCRICDILSVVFARKVLISKRILRILLNSWYSLFYGCGNRKFQKILRWNFNPGFLGSQICGVVRTDVCCWGGLPFCIICVPSVFHKQFLDMVGVCSCHQLDAEHLTLIFAH